MANHRQLERKYNELQHAIIANDGVECAQAPEAFFPEDSTPNAKKFAEIVAKSICADCPIKALCLDYAKSTRVYGVWGGTTYEERYPNAAR
jgi:WhiB family redox-sensing transcriptional regulator